jgi:threonine/homoserine/homoserine lactone efflux protein
MISFFLAWFTVMFSLVFSPGPANILLAASGARQGFAKSIPLVVGIDSVFILKSFLVGFGLAEVIERYPIILVTIQILGVAYLIWLSWVFITSKSSQEQDLDSQIGFKEGVVLQTINAKGWVMVALMYSLFSKSAGELWGSYSTLVLIILLALLNILLHMVWVMIGATIGHFNNSLRFEKIMNIVFAASLFITALWLAWSAV